MPKIALEDVFDTLANVTSAERVIAGQDPWRGMTGEDRLQHIDPELAAETKAPLSKPVGNRESLWFAMHFKIMMPALAQTLHDISQDPQAQSLRLGKEETQNLVPYWRDIRQHAADFQEFETVIRDVLNQMPARMDDLPRSFKMARENLRPASRTKETLEALLEHAETNLNPLWNALREQKGRGANIDYLKIGEALLSTLPNRPEELEPLLHQKLQNQVKQFENGANDMWGRLIQTHYAEKERNYAKYGYYDKAQDFHEVPHMPGAEKRTIHERTKAYFLGAEGLPNFPPELKTEDGAPEALSIAQIATFFSKFLRKKSVVELVHPSFDGAATRAADTVVHLVNDLAQKTDGTSDYRQVDIDGQIAANTGLLRRAGRMAMAMDIVGNGHLRPHDYGSMDGQKLRKVATDIWPEEARKTAWNHGERYTPSLQNGFSAYRQDIATVVYAAAVNLHDHREQLNGNTDSLVEYAKSFSRTLLTTPDLPAFQQHIRSAQPLLNKLHSSLASVDRMNGGTSTHAGAFSTAMGQLIATREIAR